MKTQKIYLLLVLLLIPVLIFVKTLFHDFGSLHADEIKISDGLIKNNDGLLYSGLLTGTVDHIDAYLEPFLDGFLDEDMLEKLPLSRRFKLDKLGKMKEDLEGFSVQVNVQDGKLSEQASVYYNLRAAKNDIFGYPVDKNFGFYMAYVFHNQIKLAEANFKDNMLDGSAYINGLGSHKNIEKTIEIDFDNNTPLAVKRFGNNGKLKRLNVYKNLEKHGVQKEFNRNGNLSYEVNYIDGKKDWEKSYYSTLNKIRQHVIRTDSNTVIIKEYYPDGTMAKDYNDTSNIKWYSNGEMAFYKSKDTTYNVKPKGRVETFHQNGRTETIYHYNDYGVKNGPFEVYYNSGKIWKKGSFKNNLQTGNFQKWYTNGQIAEDHQMVDGRIDGPFVRYYDTGVLWKKFNYSKGSLIGKYEKWWKNGKLAFNCECKNNLAVTCEKWNDEGIAIK